MRRGDIVLVVWPYSDMSGAKPRPAVVIQADFLNTRIADSVFVQITGTSRNTSTEIVLHPAVEVNSGLSFVSYAVCNNILTLDKRFVRRCLGELSAAALRRIEVGVKTALALP
jgi:mRNA interferase MazF